MKPWWLLALPVLFLAACSGTAAPIVCRQPIVPKVEVVMTSKLVSLAPSDTVYTLSVVMPMGEPVPVYSGADLKSSMDNRVPPCSVFIVSDESTNYDGVVVAHVLRVIEWQGGFHGYWGLSGYLPKDYLTVARLAK